MPATVISSTRPVNAVGRHPLPNGRPSAVEAARRLEGAKDLLHFWQSAWVEHDAAQVLLSLSQGLSTTRGPSNEAVAPADSTGDKLDVPQQQAQGWQEPPVSKSTGRPNGPPPSASAKSGGRRPVPTSCPVPKPEPQPQKKPTSLPVPKSETQAQKKRKRVDEEEDDEQIKEGDEEKKKKSGGRRKRGKKPEDPDNPKPFVCWCGSGFPRRDHLTRHERIVHGIVDKDGVQWWERYECDVCHHLFTRKDNFKAHWRIRHRNSGPAPKPKAVLVDKDEKDKGKRKGTAPAPTTSPARTASLTASRTASLTASRTASPTSTASHTLTASPTPDAENGQA